MRHRLVWNNDLELVLGKTNDETPTMRDVPPKRRALKRCRSVE
jgi:hypothetical protein